MGMLGRCVDASANHAAPWSPERERSQQGHPGATTSRTQDQQGTQVRGTWVLIFPSRRLQPRPRQLHRPRFALDKLESPAIARPATLLKHLAWPEHDLFVEHVPVNPRMALSQPSTSSPASSPVSPFAQPADATHDERPGSSGSCSELPTSFSPQLTPFTPSADTERHPKGKRKRTT